MFERMIDTMIHKFGFESKETLLFCHLFEDYEKGILTETDLIQEYCEIYNERRV